MESIKISWSRVLALIALFYASPVWAGSEVGKVVSLSGSVFARLEGKDLGRKGVPKVRTLKAGDPIFVTDVINTGSEGSVKILFQDQSIMDLGSSSLFKVEEFQNNKVAENRKVAMSLAYGRIRASINQKIGPAGKFKIKTRAATMGVRGTEFYVMSDIASMDAGKEAKSESKPVAPQTQVVVTEGKVEVQKTKAETGAPVAKPVAVLPGEKFTAVIDSVALDVKGESKGRSPASLPPVVEKVSAEEMKTVVSEVKLKDTTFAQAIQIDVPKSQGGEPTIAVSGVETLSVIKDSLLSKPDFGAPAVSAANFVVPGVPVVQPNFAGNFMPGFNGKLVKLHLIIK